MFVNDLDLGLYQSNTGPEYQMDSQELAVMAGVSRYSPTNTRTPQRRETVWIKSQISYGGAVAGSEQATKYLLGQLQELARAYDQNPVFIRWAASQMLAQQNAVDSRDGWYVLSSVSTDLDVTADGYLKCDITVQEVSPPYPATRYMLWYQGGVLTTNYSGASINALAFPTNSTAAGSALRAGADGSVPVIANPSLNPYPFNPPAVAGDLFRGDVVIYDTLNTTSNPAPTTSFVNPNWVEVHGPGHNWIGDCVLSNGFLMFIFQSGVNAVCSAYVWSGTAWVAMGTINYFDNSAGVGATSSVIIERCGDEECAIRVWSQTSTNAALLRIRLQRGMLFARIEMMPMTQANLIEGQMILTLPTTGRPHIYSPNGIMNGSLAAEQLTGTFAPDYGYAAGFLPDVNYPFIAGWLYQNKPASQTDVGASSIRLGDSSGPTQGSTRLYGFFAIPFVNPQNIALEVESATLGGSFVTSAEALASAGNAAKLPSGVGGPLPAPNALSGLTDGGAAGGSLTAGGYKLAQTWLDGTGETTGSLDGTGAPLTPALTQNGPIVRNNTTTTLTLTLPGNATNGRALIAWVYNETTNVATSAPAGANWQSILDINDAVNTTRLQVWVNYNHVLGGIASFACTKTNATNVCDGQVMEFSNIDLPITAVDTSGSTSGGSNSLTKAVSTSGNITQAADLAVSIQCLFLGVAGTITHTTPSGWQNAANNDALSQVDHCIVDYKIGGHTTGATLSETETSTTTGRWTSAIIALKAAPSNTVFLTANGDQINVPSISAPPGAVSGRFYLTNPPNSTTRASTQAVSGGVVPAFSISTPTGPTGNPPNSNTTVGVTSFFFGPNFTPPAGTYQLWVRARVGARNSAVNQLRVYILNNTDGTFPNILSINPNSLQTTYGWLSAGLWTTDGTKSIALGGDNSLLATTTTDFWVDEMALVPQLLSPSSLGPNSGPQDIWSTFIYDRVAQRVFT